MRFQFSFKNMDSSPALTDYATDKLNEGLDRFITKPIEAHVTFSLEGSMHHAHCSVQAGDGFGIQVDAESKDMYKTIDMMTTKLLSQLRKKKEKLKHHKGHQKLGVTAMALHQKKPEDSSQESIDAEEILKYENKVRRIG